MNLFSEVCFDYYLIFTVDSGTVAKISSLIFFNHLCNASVGQNVSGKEILDVNTHHHGRMLPRVYQAVQHLCCLFYQVRLVRIIFKLIIRLQVQNHVQSLSVVRDLLIEPSQVELVLNVVLVNLAEELISTEPAEPRDPGYLLQK